MKPTILLSNKEYFDFTSPETSVFTEKEIAHNLSHICRFTGAGKWYSVAEHSVWVSYLVPTEHQFAALLHDAAEAFLSDISSPLKQLLPDYKVIEERVEREIFERFGLNYPMHPSIKIADLRMLKTEFRDIMLTEDYPECVKNVDIVAGKLLPLSSAKAYKLFLDRFYELNAKRNKRAA
jgi:5'-deoxynucleotidase YfbR-like HD superfamily hydrolase